MAELYHVREQAGISHLIREHSSYDLIKILFQKENIQLPEAEGHQFLSAQQAPLVMYLLVERQDMAHYRGG